ncbi:MAG: acetyl-CoA carboxylase biotin carboxyl carrier protein [Planctomycetota bacterium]|jgi:acetyl-CoA carboxylase biotin carboxyl carrier protein
MAEKKTSDLKKIKELIQIMKQNDLVEVEIKHGDDKIFLKRYQAPPAGTSVPTAVKNTTVVPAGPNAAQAPATEAEPAVSQTLAEENLVEIKSPLVGTFYAAPSPDSDPCVEVGSQVEPQTVVCIIEAMKVMNEIKAETGGTIAEILVENGQAVEYGQVLFKVKPD